MRARQGSRDEHASGQRPHDPTLPGDDDALTAFEEFLVRYHEGGADLDELCAKDPAHADRYRRWWRRLLETGEVSTPAPSTSVDAAPSALAEGEWFGPYLLQREIGRGSQGTVWRAEDSRLGRTVALKLVPSYRGKDPARRFAREAELASRLDHPGLCTVFERGSIGDTAFLAMRFVEGETLASHLARQTRHRDAGQVGVAVRLRPEPQDEAAAIRSVLELFVPITDALHAAHEARLIHRDIKPGNLLIDERTGQPVVVDFGLARDSDAPALTMTGDLVGTPAYMSPEQVAAQRIEIDQRTDVYSLGATLYECLCGVRPVEAPTRAALYERILTAPLTAPRQHNPSLPPELDVVLATAMERDRSRRYQSARAFGDDLRRVLAREPIAARAPALSLRVRRWAQRNPTLASALGLLTIASAITAWLTLQWFAETRRAKVTFARLRDNVELAAAHEAARDLLPPDPQRLGALEEWEHRYGQPLAERLGSHRQHLTELRARAVSVRQAPDPDLAEETKRLAAEVATYRRGASIARTEAVARLLENVATRLEGDLDGLRQQQDQRREYSFDAPELGTAHTALESLVDDLEQFVSPLGLRTRMQRHTAWAKQALTATATRHAPAWREAAEFFKTSAPYAESAKETRLRPQFGLVPLGSDPASQLLEFAFERSGSIPQRDAEGRLEIAPDTAIVLVLIPGGTTLLPGGSDGMESAPRSIQLAPYFLAKHELTRAQWEALAGTPPPCSDQVAAFTVEPRMPVDGVSYTAALDAFGEYGLTHPTEAQWVFGTRAGRRKARFWWGDTAPRAADNRPPVANLADRSLQRLLGVSGSPRYDDGVAMLAPVDDARPNAYGLLHTIGNVSEWCREPFLRTSLSLFTARPGDGLHDVPRTGLRGIRGGNYRTTLAAARISRREGRIEDRAPTGIGVRPCRPLH